MDSPAPASAATTDEAIRSVEMSFERIAAAARLVGRSSAQRFDPELQPAAWAVLREILRSGRVQPHALAAAMSMDRSAISRLLKELRERDLIEGERDEQDGRSTWISVTPAAAARADAVMAERRSRLHERLGTWDGDDLQRFAVLLDRFADPEWLSRA